MQPEGIPQIFVAPGVPHPAFAPPVQSFNAFQAQNIIPNPQPSYPLPQGFYPSSQTPYNPVQLNGSGVPLMTPMAYSQVPSVASPMVGFNNNSGFVNPSSLINDKIYSNGSSEQTVMQMDVPNIMPDVAFTSQKEIDQDLEKYLGQERAKGVQPEKDTVLSWQNLDVFVNEKEGLLGLKKKPNPKQILFNTNGVARSGECLAIMGGSGSGKSTLLNILSGRNQTNDDYIVNGSVTINGNPVNYKKYKKVTGFVMQSDIFLEHLTVEEYFKFAIDLKHFDKTAEERKKLVDEMISLLKLDNARNTYVGGKSIKGISGGEKKRLNIGFELLANPRIIYLDEPTSGLDSYTSYIIVDVMRKLARARNLIIVYTIHQPSVDCYKLFDNVMILNLGKTIYFGSATNSINYYASMNCPVPANKNPTNHYIELAMRSTPETLQSFYNAHQVHQIPMIYSESAKHSGEEINYKTLDAGFFRQFFVLFYRAVINFFRNKVSFLVRVIQTLFICLLYCLLYARMGDIADPDKTERLLAERTYGGAIFFAAINQFIMYFMSVLVVFPAERATFSKEYTSGYYNVAPYYFSKLMVELPVIALFPLIFLGIAYFIVGFVPDAGKFFLFAAGLIMLSIWGSLMGILIGCVIHNGSLAVEVAPLVFVPLLLFSGFTQNSDSVPKWLIWVMYLSPMRYMFEWCIRSQFENVNDEYIETLNFNLGYGPIVAIAVGYMLVLIALSIVFLKIGSKSIKN